MSSLVKNKKNDNIRIPVYFVLAFLVVFAVNGYFVYIAVSTNHGVVTENAYKKGLNYNNIVSEFRQMKAKGKDGTNIP